MRLRNVKNKEEVLNNCSFLINDPKAYKGKWKKLFNNNNPIYIEIGMGKGDFIIENALKFPDINFIGIEKYDSVIVHAIEKVENKIPNLYLIRMDAIEIDEVFSKEIDIVYLNFSDPWPKKRHASRRLTSKVFLKKYDYIFKGKKTIIMKTDNTSLFEYSLVSLSNYGYKLEQVCFDLENHEELFNIKTEYEKKFSSLGYKILYLKANK